jgi:AcrR family transcriptional regulator
MARTGRRPGEGNTRALVLEAARALFAEQGYDGASMRAIAARASVDPALIHHYFGTKQDLFVESLGLPLDPAVLLPGILEIDRAELPDALAELFFQVWEDEGARERMLSLVRSISTNEQAARMMREFVTSRFLFPIADHLGLPDARLRASLIAAQVVGLAVMRFIVRVEPLVSTPREQLKPMLTAAVRAHLTPS